MLSSFCSSLSIISLNVIEIETLRVIHLAPGARKMHQNALSRKPATLGLPDNADQNLFLEATDRPAARTTAAVRRIDAATAAEVQAVRAVAIRSTRPIVAAVADTAEIAVTVVAITRKRIPDICCIAELTAEVQYSI